MTADGDLILPLASAHGDLQLMRQLIKAQHGKRLLLLRRAIDRSAAAPFPAAISSRVRECYGLLTTVQRTAPDVFRSVLLDPDVGVWLHAGGGDPGPLGQIAAVAAMRASVPATVAVPATDGRLYLPGLGTVVTGRDSGDAVVHIAAGGVKVTAGNAEIVLPRDLSRRTRQWQPVRRVNAGRKTKLRVRIAVDGPLVDAFSAIGVPAGAPCDEADWASMLAGAWHILETRHPVHAAAIAESVRVLVPVPAEAGGGSASASLAAAFGAIALSLPTRPEILAVALIHETQHAKLAAAMDLVPLHSTEDDTPYFAPWRPDPRPLGALLQGIYAHFGVAHFWQVQRQAAQGPDAALANVEFVRWRDDTWQAARTIVGVPALTAAGDLLVSRLIDELGRLRAEEVPAEARYIADLIGQDHRISWRLRNLEVDQQVAGRLAGEWLNDREPSAIPEACTQARQTSCPMRGRRTHLVYRHLSNDENRQGDFSAADILYARGDYHAALGAYEKRIVADPADLDAWAGLAVSASAEGNDALSALNGMPEIAAAVYQHAAFTEPVPGSPLHLAEWLSGAG
jgi:HEXXH motif-containing protein